MFRTGRAASSGAFAFTFNDTNGFADLKVLNVLVNNFIDGWQGCYVAFVPSGPNAGTLLLVNDAGDAAGPFASMSIPDTGTLQNGQCTISGAGSAVSAASNSLTLTLNMSFTNFSGNRVMYGAARSDRVSSDCRRWDR